MPTHLMHKENLLDSLVADVRRHMDDGPMPSHQAFDRVAAEWLGYDLAPDSEFFVDGAEDRGIDFWYASESGFDIFQVKSHELSPQGKLDLSAFDKEGVSDLHRVSVLLADEHAQLKGNKGLLTFKRRWEDAIMSRRLGDDQQPIVATLGLVLLGKGLTSSAQDEWDALEEHLGKECAVGGVRIEFRSIMHSIDDLVEARWRVENREWRDTQGHKRERIDLHPKDKTECISQANSVVFYCRAIDLVSAYTQFGYQIFEPNVRCNISKSRVNAAIRESATHRSSRREFELLNNGVTIVCSTYQKPSENRASFRVRQPGVVNGLQTVMALHEAYSALPQDQKHDFERNCFVLVRLLGPRAVDDVNKVIRATNTQNPMQPRNLRSNDSGQIFYEKFFAELGWFYERKEGAWNAFAADPQRWRTLPNKKKKDFGRPIRKVDNETLAQTWLSFIGFSDQAVHEKRYLFDADKFYDIIFLRRTTRHGSACDYHLDQMPPGELLPSAPPPKLMLASFLAHQFARQVPLTAAENRQASCDRLGLDPKSLSREELDSALFEDDEFLLAQVLNGMSYVFVDTLGYVLFKALGENVHDCGERLLETESFRCVWTDFQWDEIKVRARNEEADSNDLLPVVWSVFRHVISELIGGAWKDSYLTARNRTRFNHSRDTRTRIVNSVEELHRYLLKNEFTRSWAVGMKPGKGLFGYVEELLSP